MPVAGRTGIGLVVALMVAAVVPASGFAFPVGPGSDLGRTADCPVTLPSGQAPPGQPADPTFYGGDGLWVTLPLDGQILIPWDDIWLDGSLEARIAWWPGEATSLSVAGKRLDAPAPLPLPLPLLTAFVPDGAPVDGQKLSTLRFPTEGCWEVIAQTSIASLRFVASVGRITIDSCPVTTPNGNTPPNELPSSQHHGNGALWTGLWPEGTVVFEPGGPGSIGRNGSLAMKFWWWRGVDGQLTIDGRRLDAPAPSLRAEIPTGYFSYFQATGLIFPTVGCWEVTGMVGDASLTFVTRVIKVGG